MLDIGWTELMVVGLVLILVVGPKDLPKVLRTFGKWTSKARKVAREFQDNIEDIGREAEIDEIKKQFGDPMDINNDISSVLEQDLSISENTSIDSSKENPNPKDNIEDELVSSLKSTEGVAGHKGSQNLSIDNEIKTSVESNNNLSEDKSSKEQKNHTFDKNSLNK